MASTLAVSDIQFKIHDRKAVRLLLDFARDLRPDVIVHVGDLVELGEVSRWNKGTFQEYAGDLQRDFDEAADYLAELRKFHRGPIHVKKGNHDIRLEKYLGKYAPGLGKLRGLTLESLLRCDQLKVRVHARIFDVAPGWVCAHGDEAGTSQVAGMTALKIARKVGKSVVCGHGHRQGIIKESVGYNGRTKTITGMEVGHLLDIKKADYLETGSANWQQGWGILWEDRGRVSPELVGVEGGKVVYQGRTQE